MARSSTHAKRQFARHRFLRSFASRLTLRARKPRPLSYSGAADNSYSIGCAADAGTGRWA